jgi:hypothetical protein
VLLSYDEPLADALHARLEHALGCPVKRLHGVRGMRRAYRLCAQVADAEEFWLADGDFAIDSAFDPASIRPLDEGVSMRVRRAVNPVNGLVYGYGGLKLVRRRALRDLDRVVDVLAALPGQMEFCPQVVGVTRFNQSPFHAWKAGFLECVMLARGSEYGHGRRRGPLPAGCLGRQQQLRLAIEEPARIAGLRIAPELLGCHISDTDSGEALPLLAFTLVLMRWRSKHNDRNAETSIG